MPRSVKSRCYIVGVIATRADLQRALRMRKPPDLFELRLDCLVGNLDELEAKLSILSARARRTPLIITARDPREGGANNLSRAKRRKLLSRFLPRAGFVDVELRSVAAFRPLLELARRRNVRRIISFHDLKSTPDSRSLRARARAAKSAGADIFKVATRTDNPRQLARLLDFIATNDVDVAISAMGIGKLGAISRMAILRCGSVLNYASIGRSLVEGQLSIQQLRSALGR